MWIVFLGINSYFERAFHAAHELGLSILLITNERHLPDAVPADLVEVAQNFEFEKIVTIAEERLPKNQALVFWAVKEPLLPLANKLNQHFASPAKSYSDELLSTCKNKLKLREVLCSTPYNPRFELYAQGNRYESLFQSSRKVIKPLLGWLSIGVERVASEKEFYPAVARSLSVLERLSSDMRFYTQAEGCDVNHTLLIEEYIDGNELSVEVFVNANGVRCMGICEKTKMKPPYFEEISYCMPARINKDFSYRLIRAASEIMDILGVRSGMAHLEFICNVDRIILLDIGLRLGGSGLAHGLIHAATGVDMVKAVLAELCGMESEQYLIETKCDTALLYLLQVGDGGRIQEITQPKIKYEEKLLDLHLSIKAGDEVSGYPNYSGLPGYTLFRIPGRDEKTFHCVDQILNQLNEGWRIKYQ